jgi:hypothetical protein
MPWKDRTKYAEHNRKCLQKQIDDEKCHAKNCKRAPQPGYSLCEYHHDYSNNYIRKIRAGLRKKVLDHYGNRCACPGCECDDVRFLTIDHVNNDGAEHRKKLGGGRRGCNTLSMLRWIIKNNYPDTIQPLCMNCNSAKEWYGICPHVTDRLEAEQRKELQNV